jgi:hypothetical protein
MFAFRLVMSVSADFCIRNIKGTGRTSGRLKNGSNFFGALAGVGFIDDEAGIDGPVASDVDSVAVEVDRAAKVVD